MAIKKRELLILTCNISFNVKVSEIVNTVAAVNATFFTS